ncbi:hypothetical protein NS228_05940 [Methylobacterium indicum]|uniref:hypothetical protein n=1 Tax=Methylobacterium indicum TaxID=1775910 RepID=UPI0007343569|nr:hypothetical protein [Methylobacterium indicum]KTS30905.1 hypothetical protein NS229_14895 [Methylobacterium indicum]KTS41508.1 hypothetical protein NS228_05940 [Methylobacterium indicum]KTS52438.1 hypothetical protein NS230_09975 [Methylobacterium indicum]
MPAPFSRGQRLICVDGHFAPDPEVPYRGDDLSVPKEGRVYTVRECVMTERGWGVRFLELQNPVFHHDIGGRHEPAFSLGRFAPASEAA